MKVLNIKAILIALLFILLTVLITPSAAGLPSDPDNARTPVRSGVNGTVSAPETSAQSAIVIELKTGRVLYEKNANQKAYPASTTKIMTALLAVESGDLDRKVRISKNASGIEGSSIYLTVGEKVSLRDLLYGLMLRSGNDAAIAISEFIEGSTNRFVEKMNERAREIGAVNTNFVNPNGLFNENHFTSAYDMALIAREAMLNPEFKTIVRAKSWVADREEGKYRQFYNKNKVVFEYKGGTGIKIGFTQASGRTLVASSERNGMELICVVMNAPNWFNDSYKLMDYVYGNYEIIKLIPAQRILKAILVNDGNKDHVFIGTSEDIMIPVEKNGSYDISITYVHPAAVTAPVSRWNKAGGMEIYIDNEYVFTEPLYYMEDIDIERN